MITICKNVLERADNTRKPNTRAVMKYLTRHIVEAQMSRLDIYFKQEQIQENKFYKGLSEKQFLQFDLSIDLMFLCNFVFDFVVV